MIGVKRESLTGKVTVSKGLANVQISCDQVTYYTDSMTETVREQVTEEQLGSLLHVQLYLDIY